MFIQNTKYLKGIENIFLNEYFVVSFLFILFIYFFFKKYALYRGLKLYIIHQAHKNSKLTFKKEK